MLIKLTFFDISVELFKMNSLKKPLPLSNAALTPILRFRQVWHEGAFHSFNPDDIYSLLILQKVTAKRVSYERAYRGWRSGPMINERRSPGRAFYHWLDKHSLSIIWKETDFSTNPLLSSALCPRHDPDDELAQGHSFVIRPQLIQQRKIKLYVQDRDMIKVLSLYSGDEAPLGDLTRNYISQRLLWEKTHTPAPSFLDWLIANGKKVQVGEGDLGFFPQVSFSSS